MPLEISAKRDGFRRCGIAHTKEPKVYADDHFTDEQLQTLFDEPLLDVKVVDAEAADIAAVNLVDITDALYETLTIDGPLYGYDANDVRYGPLKRLVYRSPNMPEEQDIDDTPETDLHKSDANLADPIPPLESDTQQDQAEADTDVSDTASDGDAPETGENTENQAEDNGPTQTPVTDGESNTANVNTDLAEAGTDAAENAAAKPEPAQADKPARASRAKK